MNYEYFFLKGTQIYLRALSILDAEGNYRNWLNDHEIVKFNSHGRFPMTFEKLVSYINSTTTSTNILVLAIIDINTNNHIGNISLQSINWIDRNAEIAFLLGEKSYWGKGIMHEAGSILLKHAFDVLNLHRVYCGTSEENKGMQKLAQKLGMVQEGKRIEAIFKDGKYYNIIEFGIVNKK
jgi:ribosomal-protein-alanine N-acetyltransferase